VRPLNGIVIGIRKTGLKVRIESGLVASLPYDKKYQVGQKVLIKYDFTKNIVKSIFNSEYVEENMLEIKERKEEEGEDNDPEILEID